MIAVQLYPDRLGRREGRSMKELLKRHTKFSVVAMEFDPDVEVAIVRPNQRNPRFWEFFNATRGEYERVGGECRLVQKILPGKPPDGYYETTMIPGIPYQDFLDAKVMRRKVLHVGMWNFLFAISRNLHGSNRLRIQFPEGRKNLLIRQGPNGPTIDLRKMSELCRCPRYINHHMTFGSGPEFWAWVDPEYLKLLKFENGL